VYEDQQCICLRIKFCSLRFESLWVNIPQTVMPLPFIVAKFSYNNLAMSHFVSRKQFLQLSSFTATGLVLLPIAASAQEKPPALKPELVKEFVIAGHGNLEKVKQMLSEEPGLLNASWDWGGGDFETAIEGAGHVGNKAIANYLLEQGARANIFCLAMLGKLEIVKALLSAYPNLKDSKGPHGLQLMHHAKKGGEEGKVVLDYLQSIGSK
jgi:hypothetical protein